MKRILFLTGTRADFGKLKPLMRSIQSSSHFVLDIFVTGMHMFEKYGYTYKELPKSGFPNFHTYLNQRHGDAMDVVVAKTISGLSDYVHENSPDMIVVHGDRVETLAGAIVGSFNNILVAHIEGGEISGTIDELIRHSVSKLSHLHFVCNQKARERLIKMGELSESIKVIGSPDLDVMVSDSLPSLASVKEHYDIPFSEYSIFMYHPVTTEVSQLKTQIAAVVQGIRESGENFIIVYPNNDNGSEIILSAISELEGKEKFRIYPSLRFEAFLILLKYARSIVGNSSAGIREAPVYGIPTVNIGSRQAGRIQDCASIINVGNCASSVRDAVIDMAGKKFQPLSIFGDGNSAEQFISTMIDSETWAISHQKKFND